MADFETKDSGERMEFSGGMKRDTEKGKTLYHLVYDGPMLQRWAELLTRGAEKYDESNWMKAEGEAELKRFTKSAARHFHQWMAGDRDEDHAAAVLFNLNGAEYVRGKLYGDRPPPLAEPVKKSWWRRLQGKINLLGRIWAIRVAIARKLDPDPCPYC